MQDTRYRIETVHAIPIRCTHHLPSLQREGDRRTAVDARPDKQTSVLSCPSTIYYSTPT